MTKKEEYVDLMEIQNCFELWSAGHPAESVCGHYQRGVIYDAILKGTKRGYQDKKSCDERAFAGISQPRSEYRKRLVNLLGYGRDLLGAMTLEFVS